MAYTRSSCADDHPPLIRAFDIAVSLTVLVLILPVMVLIAFAIAIESGFPIFYIQKRLGMAGTLFGMYKFRKFGPAEGETGSPLTLEHDSRLTRVGAFLARTKLDELPQIFNVLRGEMAIVGPRPESLSFAKCFTPHFRALLRYRPGIVGPSQVFFRSECRFYPLGEDAAAFYCRVLFPAKATIDLNYYPRRTLLQDLGWMLRALAVVCLPGAVGGAKTQIDLSLVASAGGPARIADSAGGPLSLDLGSVSGKGSAR